jgi:glycosyltransferase involved in cell wall biosynthesis
MGLGRHGIWYSGNDDSNLAERILTMAPRHVLHSTNHLKVGGAEKYVVRLANAQRAAGINVSVMAGPPWVIDGLLHPDIARHCLHLWPGVPPRPVHYLFRALRYVPALVHLLRRTRVDVVHTHLAPSGIPLWLAARMCGIPSLHSMMYVASVASPLAKLFFQTRLAPVLATGFLAFSDYYVQEMATDFHVPPHKICFSRLGVDTDRFCPGCETGKVPESPESPGGPGEGRFDRETLVRTVRRELGVDESAFLVGVAARFEPVKDVALAIRAVGAARRLDPTFDVHLILAGDGPLRGELEELTRSLGLAAVVHFLGFLERPERHMPAWDVYLQTCRGPNLGLSVLEAMACGVPILIAARNDLERLMAENTLQEPGSGWVFDAEPELLASGLREIAGDRAGLDRFGEAARRGVLRHYSWDKHVREVIAIYDRLIAEK